MQLNKFCGWRTNKQKPTGYEERAREREYNKYLIVVRKISIIMKNAERNICRRWHMRPPHIRTQSSQKVLWFGWLFTSKVHSHFAKSDNFVRETEWKQYANRHIVPSPPPPASQHTHNVLMCVNCEVILAKLYASKFNFHKSFYGYFSHIFECAKTSISRFLQTTKPW